MAEKADAPVQGDLLAALDTLTDIIAEHEQRVGFDAADNDELDLDGVAFGPATDAPLPLLDPVTPAPLPHRAELEAFIDRYLDRRLADLRDALKRELLAELRTRYPAP